MKYWKLPPQLSCLFMPSLQVFFFGRKSSQCRGKQHLLSRYNSWANEAHQQGKPTELELPKSRGWYSAECLERIFLKGLAGPVAERAARVLGSEGHCWLSAGWREVTHTHSVAAGSLSDPLGPLLNQQSHILCDTVGCVMVSVSIMWKDILIKRYSSFDSLVCTRRIALLLNNC